MFSGCTVPPDSKENELGRINKEAFPSAGKNNEAVLARYKSAHRSVSLQLFPVMWVFSKVPVCYLLRQMSSQWVLTHSLPFCFWPIFNAVNYGHIIKRIYKPDSYESLALRIFEVFVRIFLNQYLPSNQTLLTFLLYVRQTWMSQLILAISLRGVIFL